MPENVKLTPMPLLFRLLLIVLILPSSALGDPWNLPNHLSDQNTLIQFEVDSNFQLIEGETNKMQGQVWLNDERNPFSVNSELTLPVSAIRTRSRSNDSTLHSMMDEPKYPVVKVQITGTGSHCTPEIVNAKPCDTTLYTLVTIKEVTQSMQIPVTIFRRNENYIIQGRHSFEWAKFGIEDHSPFLVVLDPEVKVSFQITLPPAPLG